MEKTTSFDDLDLSGSEIGILIKTLCQFQKRKKNGREIKWLKDLSTQL